MNDKTKIILAGAVIVLATVMFGVAVANAYYASTQANNPYGTYGNYGPQGYADNYDKTAPSNPYGSFGSYGPYNDGYANCGSWGGRMGGWGGMGGFRMGMP